MSFSKIARNSFFWKYSNLIFIDIPVSEFLGLSLIFLFDQTILDLWLWVWINFTNTERAY